MRIIINTAHQRFGGGVQVALSFIYECIHYTENEYHVFVGPGVKKVIKESDFPENFFFYYFDFGEINFFKTWKINRKLSLLETKIEPDCIVSTSGPTYFHSKAPQIIGFNLGLYIYPESPYFNRLTWYRRVRFWIKRRIHFYFFKRDGIAFFTQTNDVNKRVRNAFATDKVYTVSNTHNSFYTLIRSFPNRLPDKPKGFFRFVTISSYYPHKDLEIIPKIAKLLEEKGVNNIQFVTTLETKDFDLYLSPHPFIINIGPIPPDACPSLYQECDGMFLPTLVECFSASYPEAMIMGKPIVTTDLGFARSICDDSAVYYRATDAQSAMDCIIHLVSDVSLRERLVESGKLRLNQFDTPSNRAEKILSLCNKYKNK